jgi:hypothetical protein
MLLSVASNTQLYILVFISYSYREASGGERGISHNNVPSFICVTPAMPSRLSMLPLDTAQGPDEAWTPSLDAFMHEKGPAAFKEPALVG